MTSSLSAIGNRRAVFAHLPTFGKANVFCKFCAVLAGEAREHVLVHVAAVPVERTAQVLYALLVRFTGEIHVVICPRKPIEKLGGVAALDVKQRFAVVICGRAKSERNDFGSVKPSAQ